MAGGKYRHVYSTNKGNASKLSGSDKDARLECFKPTVTINPYEAAMRHVQARMRDTTYQEYSPMGRSIVKREHHNHTPSVHSPTYTPFSTTAGGMHYHGLNNPSGMLVAPDFSQIDHYYCPEYKITSDTSPYVKHKRDAYCGASLLGCVFKEKRGSKLKKQKQSPQSYHSGMATLMQHQGYGNKAATLIDCDRTVPQSHSSPMVNTITYIRPAIATTSSGSSLLCEPMLTDNCIKSIESLQVSSPQLINTTPPASPTNSVTNKQKSLEETEYPHLALDLSRIKKYGVKFPTKPNAREKKATAVNKEVSRASRVSMGKPLHPYTACFNDPVEKELERWHNNHCSTITWERVKRGVYTADGREVHLVKLNGCLYVKGSDPSNKRDHIAIDSFVQSVQANAS